jgi:maleate isomerase
MMEDYLGWRKLIGIATPSVNTCVQPECDSMRPPGVTNHVGRMYVPDLKVSSNEDFAGGIDLIYNTLDVVIDALMTLRPDALTLAISAVAIWGGTQKSSDELKAKMQKRAGKPINVSLATDAIIEALKLHGVKRKIAIVEPYYPVIQPRMESFFGEHGIEVVKFTHLQGPQYSEYTRVSTQYLVDALRNADSSDAEAVVQFGANLPIAKICDEAERWLNKPVVAVNVATYWHALRHAGIKDKVYGYTRLMSEF